MIVWKTIPQEAKHDRKHPYPVYHSVHNLWNRRGVTAAYMMSLLGAGIEANPAASYLFTTYGFNGVMLAKMWFTFAMLFAVFVIQLKSPTNMYWTINGFLAALTAGGIMAVNANLTAVSGLTPEAPGEIILIYLFLVLILTEAGSFVDNNTVTLATG